MITLKHFYFSQDSLKDIDQADIGLKRKKIYFPIYNDKRLDLKKSLPNFILSIDSNKRILDLM